MTSKKLYIGIKKEDGIPIGHIMSIGEPTLYENYKEAEKKLGFDSKAEDEALAIGSELTFATVFRNFQHSMESYRKFIALTLAINSSLSAVYAAREMQEFVSARGVERTDLSSEITTMYELDINHYREYEIYDSKIRSAKTGAKHLPEAMIIGLVSVYDAFLSQLLRVVFHLHPEIVLTSDKEIKFSDLIKYKSIEDARNALIDKEIDTALRKGHDDQFDWMQSKFSLPLKSDLQVWPKFVELCERRNLFTHTGGIVSHQYIQSGHEHKFDVSNVSIGARLKIDGAYYKSAVNTIYEIGVKLCSVFWRKFSKDEREQADKFLNDLCFDLITDHAYDLAEVLLKFGATTLKSHHSEMSRRMMVINLANAIRLQNRKEEAIKVLDLEDWSACSNDFLICVAAVKGEIDSLIKLMENIGSSGVMTKENYRFWPVFRSIQTDEKFISKFEEIFKEPLNPPEMVKTGINPEEVEAKLEIQTSAMVE